MNQMMTIGISLSLWMNSFSFCSIFKIFKARLREALVIRYTHMDHYLIDIQCLTEAFGGSDFVRSFEYVKWVAECVASELHNFNTYHQFLFGGST